MNFTIIVNELNHDIADDAIDNEFIDPEFSSIIR
jgi:hypothetical protein